MKIIKFVLIFTLIFHISSCKENPYNKPQDSISLASDLNFQFLNSNEIKLIDAMRGMNQQYKFENAVWNSNDSSTRFKTSYISTFGSLIFVKEQLEPLSKELLDSHRNEIKHLKSKFSSKNTNELLSEDLDFILNTQLFELTKKPENISSETKINNTSSFITFNKNDKSCFYLRTFVNQTLLSNDEVIVTKNYTPIGDTVVRIDACTSIKDKINYAFIEKINSNLLLK